MSKLLHSNIPIAQDSIEQPTYNFTPVKESSNEDISGSFTVTSNGYVQVRISTNGAGDGVYTILVNSVMVATQYTYMNSEHWLYSPLVRVKKGDDISYSVKGTGARRIMFSSD